MNRFLSLAILVCLFPAVLRADILFLSDQKYVRGTVISQTPDEIIFKDESGLEKKYKKKNVRRLVYQTLEEQEASDLRLEKMRTRQDRIDQAQREKRERLDPRPEPVVSDAFIPTEVPGNKNGLRLRTIVSQITGTTDIEGRLRDERFYTAGFSGAVGLNAPWSNASAWSLPVEIEYSIGQLTMELGYAYSWSQPRSFGFELGAGSPGAVALGRADLAQIHFKSWRPSILAKYDFNQGEWYSFGVIGGVRQTRRSAEFESDYFPVRVLDIQGAYLGGIGHSLMYRIRTQSRDLVLGGELVAKPGPRSELQFRLALHSGQGRWRQERTSVDLLANGMASGLARNEDALYQTAGTELRIGYAWLVRDNLRLLGRLTIAGATTRTGRNLPTRLDSSNDAPARYAADIWLSGPGRTQPNQSIGLEIGSEFLL
ncbi:MAG: hypothetical protein JNM27_04140 [Leptospirales bacterium]|nr:hypothetical protein [Leptospirales bacterium]